MAVGITGGGEPITAMRAVLKIEGADLVDSKWTNERTGEAQKQFALVLKVVSGAGERDGETFNDWVTFPASGQIGAGTKAGQVLSAALGEAAEADSLEELAAKLEGKYFEAQIGTSKNGQYSRIIHDTITEAKRKRKREVKEEEEEEFGDLPF